MIKTKNLLILALVLVVLLGVSLMQKTRHREATTRSSVVQLVAPGFVADDLIRITLGFGDDGEAVVLSNTPTGWTVDTAWQAPASKTRVEALVRDLAGLGGEFRSGSADVLGDYGLGQGQGVRIRGYNPAGETVIALDAGNKPSGGQGVFVRLADQADVYLSQTNVLAQLGIYGNAELPQSRYFVELQAVQVDRNDVDRMVIRDGDRTLDLVKVFAVEPPSADAPDSVPTVDRLTWEWQLAGQGGAGLAKTKVDAVLNSAVAIRATDLVDPTADPAGYGLVDVARQVELHLQDTRVITLRFGAAREAADKAPAGTFLQVDGEPAVWVATDFTLKNIFKSLEDLRAES